MKRAYEYECYETNEVKNEITVVKKSIVFSDNAYTLIQFKKLFGFSILEKDKMESNDVYIGMKLAYVLVCPDVTEKMSYEEWLKQYPMEAIITISKAALEHLTTAFTLGKN